MIALTKGTKDMLPQNAYKWHFVEGTAREVAKLFNVKEIRTPVFEHTELFLRGVGDTSDIVNIGIQQNGINSSVIEVIRESEFERLFFTKLVEMNIPVTIESNIGR